MTPGILRRIFSFPIAMAVGLCVLAVLTARGRFDDPDLWWHLKMGQMIWTTHTIPLVDLFSYTTNHHATIPQEWLSQLSIYAAYLCGGYSGLMLWLCILTSAVLIAGYGLCALYSGNAKVAFPGAVVLWFFATVGIAIRPQMVGYLLLLVELILIQLGRTRSPRWFLGLPLLFVLWINCHGSFFLGVLVAGVYLFASCFDFQMGSLVARRWLPHTRRVFALSLVLSAVILFLNPGGLKQILYPLDTLLHQPLNLANVEEWQPTQMTSARGVALLIVLLCCFLPVLLSRAEIFWDEFLLLILAAWLGISHVRMLFAFGILAVPILCRQLSTQWESYDPEQDRIWPNALFFTAALTVAYFLFPSSANLQGQVEAQSPVKAVEFLKASRISGPMLNEYVFGGYLLWAAPEYPVMIDGRADVYEWSGFLAEFGRWATLQSPPNALLDQYKVHFCLLARQSPMARILPLLPEWKSVYADSNSILFVRSATINPAR